MTNSQMKPLSDLLAGEHGVVCQFRGGHEYTGHLAALGFTPGVEIVVARNEGHGPILVIARGARMALGRGEAGKIMVEKLAKSADFCISQSHLTKP